MDRSFSVMNIINNGVEKSRLKFKGYGESIQKFLILLVSQDLLIEEQIFNILDKNKFFKNK